MGHVLTGDPQLQHRVQRSAQPTKKGGFSPEQEGLGKQKESRKDEHLFDNILYFADAEWARMKETLIKIPIHDTFHL